MKDYEALAQKHAESVIECNPDATIAEGLIATSFLSGCNEGKFGGAIGEQRLKDLTFGQAVEHLKEGRYIARAEWYFNTFLWLKPATTIKSEWCKDPKLKNIVDANGGDIEALGTICMLTPQKKILSGWCASQADILAEDWFIENSDLFVL